MSNNTIEHDILSTSTVTRYSDSTESYFDDSEYKLSLKMIRFVYNKMGLNDTQFINIWIEFKDKYPENEQTPMELKLLFARVLKNISEFEHKLTSYQKRYFNDYNLLGKPMYSNETLMQLDHVEGKDFIWYNNLDMKKYVNDLRDKTKKNPCIIVTTERMFTSKNIPDNMFEMTDNMKQYFNYFLRSDEEKSNNVVLEIIEIRKRLKIFRETNSHLPSYEYVMDQLTENEHEDDEILNENGPQIFESSGRQHSFGITLNTPTRSTVTSVLPRVSSSSISSGLNLTPRVRRNMTSSASSVDSSQIRNTRKQYRKTLDSIKRSLSSKPTKTIIKPRSKPRSMLAMLKKHYSNK